MYDYPSQYHSIHIHIVSQRFPWRYASREEANSRCHPARRRWFKLQFHEETLCLLSLMTLGLQDTTLTHRLLLRVSTSSKDYQLNDSA